MALAGRLAVAPHVLAHLRRFPRCITATEGPEGNEKSARFLVARAAIFPAVDHD